mgnify:CR=1 FL=1
MKYEDLYDLTDKIPNYERFFYIDELKERSRKLAEQFESVSLEKIGKSRNNESIEALKIGEGEKTALLFAMPHPNEPIGSLTLDFLSRELAENDELRKSFDFSLITINCIDPDGSRLNEGWFDGPFTPLNYAKNFYRPPHFQQVEWSFPIDYKNLHFDNPIPETEALMKIIDEEKPDFLYSLHNAGFGGAYFYVSDPCESVYDSYRRSAVDQSIPLHLGEPEMPYAESLSRAVYRMPTTKERYDYLEEYTDKDPAEAISGGTGSTDYGKRANKDMFSLVCEVPYFYDPRIEDHGLSEVERRQAILDSVDLSEEMSNFLKVKYAEVEEQLVVESKFREAIEDDLRTAPYRYQSKREWARKNSELEKPATVSQKFDNYVITRFYRMLSFGMFLRMLDEEKKRSKEESKIKLLEETGSDVLKELEEHNEKLIRDLSYEVIPIKKLVATQLLSGLISMDYLS